MKSDLMDEQTPVKEVWFSLYTRRGRTCIWFSAICKSYSQKAICASLEKEFS
jgi:hypothetical protein